MTYKDRDLKTSSAAKAHQTGKRKSTTTGKESDSKASKIDSKVTEKKESQRGFARGLPPEKIIGATNEPGELFFLIKWKVNCFKY